MRLLVSNETFHNGQIQVQTPHGLVEITQPGAYSIEIIGGSSVRNANTDVIVSQGQATVVVGEQRLLLQDRQRALLDGTNLPTLDTNVARKYQCRPQLGVRQQFSKPARQYLASFPKA